MGNTNEATQIKVRLTPSEITQFDAEKPKEMTRAAWAKHRLLSEKAATGSPNPERIAREFEDTRDLIRERDERLIGNVRRELQAELTNLEIKMSVALKSVAAAITNAGARSGQ